MPGRVDRLDVMRDLDEDTKGAVDRCARAHARLLPTLERVDDATARQPSLLPGWSVGHVLTHLARNADSLVRILSAAARGEAVEQYEGGSGQRAADIDAGAGRSAADLRDDVLSAAGRLERAFADLPLDAWDGNGLAGGIVWPCRTLPFHRRREVEVHHVDLGLGYTAAHWPADYVEWELPMALSSLPDRLAGDPQRRAVLAWLLGRGDQPPMDLSAWQSRRENYHRR
jgi:maleylpyruvate isomerase